jgi:hypothetical protein
MRLDSYTKGNTAAFSIVTVPTPQQEMDRLVSRQRWSRSKEKQRCLKRARSLMLTHGITAPDEWWDNDSWKILQKHLPAPLASQVGYWRGIGLEIQKGHDTLSEELRKAGERRRRPKGFGALSMEELSREILDWNRFKNRREVSSYTGLCPSEYSSGQSRSQGSVTKHGKDKSVWEAFARSLEEHHGHPRQIQEVSMDMSPAYIAGVNDNIGSQAKVVFDQFYVVATASKAVDETRRAEARQSASAHNVLNESRWVWLKNPENLTDKIQESGEGKSGHGASLPNALESHRNL